MTKNLILDTETTGKIEPQAIEIAWLEVDFPSLETFSFYEERFKPTKEIELGAIATHLIFPEMLTKCRSIKEFEFPNDVDYIIGHNIDYDWKVLGEPNVKRIDTLAIARKLLPELDSHTQTALICYMYGFSYREKLKSAHSAIADVKMCKKILWLLLEELKSKGIVLNTIEELWQYSETARIPEIISFGKHKGTKIKDLPWDYRNWLLRQSELDPYLEIALRNVR